MRGFSGGEASSAAIRPALATACQAVAFISCAILEGARDGARALFAAGIGANAAAVALGTGIALILLLLFIREA